MTVSENVDEEHGMVHAAVQSPSDQARRHAVAQTHTMNS